MQIQLKKKMANLFLPVASDTAKFLSNHGRGKDDFLFFSTKVRKMLDTSRSSNAYCISSFMSDIRGGYMTCGWAGICRPVFPAGPPGSAMGFAYILHFEILCSQCPSG